MQGSLCLLGQPTRKYQYVVFATTLGLCLLYQRTQGHLKAYTTPLRVQWGLATAFLSHAFQAGQTTPPPQAFRSFPEEASISALGRPQIPWIILETSTNTVNTSNYQQLMVRTSMQKLRPDGLDCTPKSIQSCLILC